MKIKYLFAVLAMIAIFNVEAKLCVSNVVCQQQYPWNGKVDIDYELFGDEDDTNIWILTATGYDAKANNPITISALTGDGVNSPIKPGKHHMVWDVNKDNPNLRLDAITIKVTAGNMAPYMVIDLSAGPDAESYPISYLASEPLGGWTEEYKTTKMVLRRIIPGTFTMGSPANELGRRDDEVQHEVTLTKYFYIGVFETTQKQYELITGSNPSDNLGDMRPVERVDYLMLRGTRKGPAWPANNDVDKSSFFGKLRVKTYKAFDLPTEAQWEYACRAGTTTALNSGKNLSDVTKCDEMAEVGRYDNNKTDGKDGYSEHTTVGSYLPNAWGLYDMHGNVCEWCLDWYEKDLGSAPVTEPNGAENGENRVLRGGSWYFTNLRGGASFCRSASRASYKPDLSTSVGFYGFRVALVQDYQIQKNFEFEIESETENPLPVFKVKLYGKLVDGSEHLLEEMGKVEYDGASGIVVGKGKHKLTWIPNDEYANLVNEVKLRVEYKDVTEQATYLVLDTTSNKMRVSPNAPDTTDDKCRTDELWLRRIEPGTFTMGSPTNELGRYIDEVQHEVTLTKCFYIGVFETTQKQYELITGSNPSAYKGDTRPVEEVSYDDLRGYINGCCWPENNEVDKNSFIGRLRKKVGNIFDLPTEAQWEYACRAGTTAALNNGTNLGNISEDENMNKLGRYKYNKNDYNEHTTVGSYLPNAWGLYDMHGNVWEWCLDWYEKDLGSAPVFEPKGAENGENRVLRGGSWRDDADYCRSAYRRYGHNRINASSYGIGIGFRVVLVQ